MKRYSSSPSKLNTELLGISMSRPISIVSTIVFLAVQVLLSENLLSQAPIVLRDLTLIRGKTISKFDRTAITLSDGTTLQWDQVLKAELPKPTHNVNGGDSSELQNQRQKNQRQKNRRQSQFDSLLKQIGLPMFRLKTRIQQGDWVGAGKIAEPIFDSAMAGTFEFPNPDVEYLVCLATMKSRAGQGSWARNRAGAVLPYLRAFSIQANVDQKTLQIAGTTQRAKEREDGISPELLPVWFDIDQVRAAVNQIKKLNSKIDQPDSGQTEPSSTSTKMYQTTLAIYLASMQIELGQNELANANLNRLRGDKNNSISSWSTVLQARMLQKAGSHVKAQAMLDKNSKSISGDARPVAIYYRGLSEFEIHDTKLKEKPLTSVVDTELSRASLMLMRLPAIYGNSNPDLAAAGLHQVAKIAKLRGQKEQSKKLSQELLQWYPRTYHGSLEPTGIIAQ